MEKEPPQYDKAAVNRDLASEITDVLAADPEINHQEMVTKLKKPGEDILTGLTPAKADALHMALGICGEAGELADAIKKWAIYGKDLDLENVTEELGDLEFFLEGLRQIIALPRDATLEHNFAKLGKRYKGHQYSDAAAIERADKVDVPYAAELRDLPVAERYTRLKELMPSRTTIGDLNNALKRLRGAGIEVVR